MSLKATIIHSETGGKPMLVPKLRLITVKTDDGQSKCCCGYCVWDTDKEEYVETGYFTEYMKKRRMSGSN